MIVRGANQCNSGGHYVRLQHLGAPAVCLSLRQGVCDDTSSMRAPSHTGRRFCHTGPTGSLSRRYMQRCNHQKKSQHAWWAHLGRNALQTLLQPAHNKNTCVYGGISAFPRQCTPIDSVPATRVFHMFAGGGAWIHIHRHSPDSVPLGEWPTVMHNAGCELGLS